MSDWMDKTPYYPEKNRVWRRTRGREREAAAVVWRWPLTVDCDSSTVSLCYGCGSSGSWAWMSCGSWIVQLGVAITRKRSWACL